MVNNIIYLSIEVDWSVIIMLKRSSESRVMRIVLILLAIFVVVAFIPLYANGISYGATYKTYTISPTSKPCSKTLRNYSTYNSKTKHYYLLRSYMEKFEKAGGGTLVLKKGTYNIPVTVYIPSNVTIKLSNGVKLNKTSTTGTSKIKYSKSMFMLCAPSKSKVANKYKTGKYKNGYTKYNGVKNVKIIGTGTTVVDMNYLKGGLGVEMAHTKNVTFSNIYFKESNTSHFLEIDASYNVNVTGCTFKSAKNAAGNAKEAINLDTPDLNTGGFTAPWSSFDKTADKNITISNCKFYDLYRSIGTHNYSYGHPHENITISNCTIKNMKSDAISAMYWKNSTIKDNTISNIAEGKNYRAILGPGTDNITITGNTFSNMDRVAQFYSWKDDGYSLIDANITEDNISNIASGNNTYTDVNESFIRISSGWDSNANTPDWGNNEKVSLTSKLFNKISYALSQL